MDIIDTQLQWQPIFLTMGKMTVISLRKMVKFKRKVYPRTTLVSVHEIDKYCIHFVQEKTVINRSLIQLIAKTSMTDFLTDKPGTKVFSYSALSEFQDLFTRK